PARVHRRPGSRRRAGARRRARSGRAPDHRDLHPPPRRRRAGGPVRARHRRGWKALALPLPCEPVRYGAARRHGRHPRRQGPADLRAVGELMAFRRAPEPPRDMKDALGLLPLARTVMGMRPKTVKSAPAQEVVLTGADIDLGALPVQTCWPGEPAPLITWPLV